ncbi:MAG TPA: VTT domain-containing protein [Dehalococcoidia bacterium]|nr:VTT domain-containing protein [Dehalococcoidia bacterium]
MPRRLLRALVALLAIAALAATTAAYVFDWFDDETMRSLGYIGIFLTNFLPHVTLFFPLPGFAATGHAMILWGADELNPVAVVVIATVAMTAAEFTSYWAGATGRAVMERRRKANVGGQLQRWMSAAARRTDTLMKRAGYPTLFLLSAIPNPILEFAGITAGATRMNFLGFNIAVGLGHLVRVTLLVILGREVI